MKIAIQMDPVDAIHPQADSTFALGVEGEARGHEIFHYLPDDLALREGEVIAHVRPARFHTGEKARISLGDEAAVGLAGFDVVLMRQDPPFDMAYITATHILEHLAGRTLVVNNPVEVRNAPEKLFVTHFAALMPPTLIARRAEEVRAFRRKHGDIVVKPLYGNGGKAVFRIRPEDENLNALIDLFIENSREPFIAQKYLPEIRKGDKRIILVDGKPKGAVNRIPGEGEARSNLHVGGRAEKTGLTDRDREICETIGPELARRGLVFVGIDVIGEYLTEINVTSPTGIQEIRHLGGGDIAADIWDAIEKKCG